MNNCCNEKEDFSDNIIRPHPRHCRPIFCIGPTGPTERLFKSSNSIIIDSS